MQSAAVRNIPIGSHRAQMPESETRIPISIDDFFDLSEDCEYKVEYRNGEMITMGRTTMTHEQLVMRIGHLLSALLDSLPEYTVYGSNTGLYLPGVVASYSPDVVVVKGEPEMIIHQRKRKAKLFTNPFMVVEVLSTGTKTYDFSEKLPDYQKISGLAYIVFVNQYHPAVHVFSRTTNPNVWLNTNIEDMDGVVQIGEWVLSMRDIYKKLFA